MVNAKVREDSCNHLETQKNPKINLLLFFRLAGKPEKKFRHKCINYTGGSQVQKDCFEGRNRLGIDFFRHFVKPAFNPEKNIQKDKKSKNNRHANLWKYLFESSHP